MSVFDILTMIGGLALFLYGMEVMGSGLSKASGGRMERILEKMTGNVLKAVLLGAGVTAVIQSSSATTVMVVGFVNSGIMKLSQAVGVIMGANIGTTVTSWLLSLTGIQGDNLILTLMKPSSFSPVLAVIGVAFLMFSKNEKKKDIGTILVGFSVLMFGMETMSDAVKPLANVPEFTNILLMFKNPLLGMLAGMILTAVIQSSSASVGILQSLCVTGAVSYGAAIPIIMGQNIGTCVTALLSSIGASKNARRTAFVHLYFNVIGTALFMILFYTLNFVLDFGFVDEIANPAGIAVIHSIFNILATLILLPFHGVLEKLAIATVRDTAEEAGYAAEEEEQADALLLLDERFIEKPGFAMENCREVAVRMAELSKKALFTAMELLLDYDEKRAEHVLKLENDVDHYEDKMGTYLIQLSSRNLSEKDSKMLSMLLHCIGDLERISDHAVNIMESAQEMASKGITFSDRGEAELEVYSRAVHDIIEMSVEAFEKDDAALARQVEPLEEVIDQLNDELKGRHVERLRNGECSMEMGFVLSDITINYERVADHCSNIAVCLLRIHENAFDVHQYLDELKENKDEIFRAAYLKDKEIYALPQQ
ncbi:MAG: Na/Pi cotransporter family protein [Coprococcus sp.]